MTRLDMQAGSRVEAARLETTQSHGVLIGVKEGRIAALSENASGLFGDIALGDPAGRVVGESVLDRLALLRERPRGQRLMIEHLETVRGRRSASIHRNADDLTLVETWIEPPTIEVRNALSWMDRAITRIFDATTDARGLDKLLPDFVDMMRQAVGTDHALFVRMGPDGGGDVVAEAMGNREVQPCKGLRVPPAYVPAYSRRALNQHPVRFVHDVYAAPVRVVHLLGDALDLSGSLLRSPSRIHQDRLDAVGMASSFTMGISMGEELWGIVVAQAVDPVNVSVELWPMMELVAATLASKALAVELAERVTV